MNKEQIITCKSYEEICDFSWHTPGLEIPENCKSIWVPIELFKHFEYQHGNTGSYNIVSTCSDIGVTYQEKEPPFADFSKAFWLMRYVNPPNYQEIGYKGLELGPRYEPGQCNPNDKFSAKMWAYTYHTFNEIPKSFNKWFMVNMSIEEPNTFCLPFGISPNKQEEICKVMAESHERNKLLYVNFQISQEERFHIQRYFQTKEFPFVTFKTTVPYIEYLRDLKQHKFCLVPPGNGIDSYRLLECLYCGCIPVVPYNRVTRHFSYFPLMYIDIKTWIDIFANLVPFDWEGFLDMDTSNINWDIKQLKLSYWKDLING